MNFDTNSISLSSTEKKSIQEIKSKHIEQFYAIIDWNNRQSLINFIRTIKMNINLSNMKIEQLQQLIINFDHKTTHHNSKKITVN